MFIKIEKHFLGSVFQQPLKRICSDAISLLRIEYERNIYGSPLYTRHVRSELWLTELEKGACLNIFHGHYDKVTIGLRVYVCKRWNIVFITYTAAQQLSRSVEFGKRRLDSSSEDTAAILYYWSELLLVKLEESGRVIYNLELYKEHEHFSSDFTMGSYICLLLVVWAEHFSL